MTLKTTLATGLFAAFAAFPAFADDMKVVASFSILGDMVEQVVGDHAEVTSDNPLAAGKLSQHLAIFVNDQS